MHEQAGDGQCFIEVRRDARRADFLEQPGAFQRAARLRALASFLNERKETLYAISQHTGATRSDGWVDIEGGSGTLFAYAGVGAADLPSGNVVHEGPAQPLGVRSESAR